MLYKNESTKRKNKFQGKKTFFRAGGLDFFQISAGIDQEVEGGVDQHSFLGGIVLYRGEKFFQGGD